MSNTSRRTSLTYPNGRVVNLGYGSSDSIDDLFSLVKTAAISGESGNKVDYTRVGLGRFVKISYPKPGVEMSMIRPGGGSMGDSGDPYDGYDSFGRVQEMRWQSSSTGTPVDAWQWGYNEASNRTWKKNLVAASGQDEAYGYDGLYQVILDALGTLNTLCPNYANSALSSLCSLFTLNTLCTNSTLGTLGSLNALYTDCTNSTLDTLCTLSTLCYCCA